VLEGSLCLLGCRVAQRQGDALVVKKGLDLSALEEWKLALNAVRDTPIDEFSLDTPQLGEHSTQHHNVRWRDLVVVDKGNEMVNQVLVGIARLF
jgi:hypothetical protein